MSLDFPQLVIILLNGLVIAANLFIVSSGKAIVYGVSRTSNFAHGSLFMVGAYTCYTLVQALPPGTAWFFVACALSALAVGVLGLLIETSIFRRIYSAPHHLQLIATFGLFMILRDLTLVIWGPYQLMGPRVPAFSGTVQILGRRFPEYNFVILGASVILLALLWLLFQKTRWGTLLRAAAHDRDMVAALGVDQKWLFTGVFILGAVLAGAAGALQIPRKPAYLGMDLDIVVQAFAVIVIGGMGSIMGAFVASILVGIVQAIGAVFFSEFSIVLVFVLMAASLIFKPNGLMGKHVGHNWKDPVASASVIRRAGPRGRLGWAALVAVLALLPLMGSNFLLTASSETLIFALFAFSFYMMGGPAGMMSFGQAVFFAVGMYAAALMLRDLGMGMGWALIGGPLAAALFAGVLGFFYIRVSGIRLAMLSLAFCQLVWAVLYQWYDVTNGDNGILNLWPPEWAAGRTTYYYIVLALTGGGIWLMRHLIFSPFGYSLRAGRDSDLRADATGIDLARQRWLGFVISGAFAGLAGVLMVYLKGSAFPGYADIATSFDALVMALLGGLESLSGPLFGTVVYRLLKISLQIEFERWNTVMGLILILMAIFLPRGLKGLADDILARRGKRTRTPAEAPRGTDPARAPGTLGTIAQEAH